MPSAATSADFTFAPSGRADVARADARPYSLDRWFTTSCSLRIAPGRFAHAPTWVTAWCSVVRAAALDVSSVPRAAACWAASTAADGDDVVDTPVGDGERLAGEDVVDWAGDRAGADWFDRATPVTTATITAATAAAARAGRRARRRGLDGPGPAPSGSPVA